MFTANEILSMFDDDGDKKEIIRTILCDAKDNNGASRRIVKAYIESINFAVKGKEYCAKPHNHVEQAMVWLRRPYISDSFMNRIKDEALAEQLEGIL